MKMTDQNLLAIVPTQEGLSKITTLSQIHELLQLMYPLTTILEKVD